MQLAHSSFYTRQLPPPSIQRWQISPPATKVVALTNVQIFDITLPLLPGTVMVDGGVIGAVIPIGRLTVDIDEVINGENGVLLPKLNDTLTLIPLSSFNNRSSWGIEQLWLSFLLSAWPAWNTACHSLQNQEGLTFFFTTGTTAAVPGRPYAIMFDTSVQDAISSPDQVD